MYGAPSRNPSGNGCILRRDLTGTKDLENKQRGYWGLDMVLTQTIVLMMMHTWCKNWSNFLSDTRASGVNNDIMTANEAHRRGYLSRRLPIGIERTQSVRWDVDGFIAAVRRRFRYVRRLATMLFNLAYMFRAASHKEAFVGLKKKQKGGGWSMSRST